MQIFLLPSSLIIYWRTNLPFKEPSETERILIALTALALNAPSTYTIAWSKEEHKEQLPILYAGIATSATTVFGAILGKRWYGHEIMWGGLIATLVLFGYAAFVYHPTPSIGAPQILEITQTEKGENKTCLLV